MADGGARQPGGPGVVRVHKGPGRKNALTAITEAAKSRTPMLILAADVSTGAVTSNFRIDVDAISRAIGATPARLHSPGFAVNDTLRAYLTARNERRTVVLALPLDVQAAECSWPGPPEMRTAAARSPAPDQAAALASALAAADRPVFIAGRGARHVGARQELERLAAQCGALLATSAAAKGLFRGSPWDLDVSGGFASPLAAELIGNADVLVGWGCSLNMWTTRPGTLIRPRTTPAPVGCDSSAPRTPPPRPCQGVGPRWASAIARALARPTRLAGAALGAGGGLMGISELEPAVRLQLPMVIVIYDDEASGAEVHHFGPDGYPLDTVRFPPADLAAIARGFGCDAVTVRSAADLGPVRDWLASHPSRPLVIDAKVTSDHGAWWLEEAFRGH